MSTTSEADAEPKKEGGCYWKPPNQRNWEPRIDIEDIEIGQRLRGKFASELVHGKTGLKSKSLTHAAIHFTQFHNKNFQLIGCIISVFPVWFDCGLARKHKKTGEMNWVTAMLRFGDARMKKNVRQRTAKRFRNKPEVELFVNRIFPDNGWVEVVLKETDVIKSRQPKIPASSLKPGDEVEGTVTKVEPYGVFVDCGANRNGLLHIQKVADQYGGFIDKEKGLEECGLGKGAKIKCAVLSNEKKRLFLDFTESTKKEADALKPGDEVVATVVMVKPNGVLLDCGVHRIGLLHIQRVADLFEEYIKKEKGLEECGLEKGAKIKCAVLSHENKRLFFDFTEKTKKETIGEEIESQIVEPQEEDAESTGMSEDELSAWADFAADPAPAPETTDEEATAWAAYGNNSDVDDGDDEYYDDEDEDRNIEDALGLGSW